MNIGCLVAIVVSYVFTVNSISQSSGLINSQNIYHLAPGKQGAKLSLVLCITL